MSQPKKKAAVNRPAEKAPISKEQGKLRAEAEADRARKQRRTAFIIAAGVISLIVIIILVSLYIGSAPLRRTIIRVDDTSINIGYFLKRARLTGSDPTSMLQSLANEQVIKIQAPKYGIEVRPEDVDQELRIRARGASEDITETEFREWYRQQLNESRLSDSEYRELTRTSLLAAGLHMYLAERVPTAAEHVYLHIIVLETYYDALDIRARWEEGEDFADLAREASFDEETRDKGGDYGWVAGGILLPGFEYEVFRLSPGDVSDPIPYASDPSSEEVFYYLFMVSEKDDAREMDEGSLETVRGQALANWLAQETGHHEVTYHGLNNGFDSETAAWLNWQLARE